MFSTNDFSFTFKVVGIPSLLIVNIYRSTRVSIYNRNRSLALLKQNV